jgi:protein-arginine kinase activator protein McsA
MKTCTKCEVDQPLENFRVRDKAKNTHQSWCKSCMKSHESTNYANNPVRRQAIRDNTRVMQNQNRVFVWKYLESHPCESCGTPDPRVLEFDHIDPSTKTGNVADLVSHSFSISKIEEEISKCRVLCANCHRLHTYEQQGWTTF